MKTGSCLSRISLIQITQRRDDVLIQAQIYINKLSIFFGTCFGQYFSKKKKKKKKIQAIKMESTEEKQFKWTN